MAIYSINLLLLNSSPVLVHCAMSTSQFPSWPERVEVEGREKKQTKRPGINKDPH